MQVPSAKGRYLVSTDYEVPPQEVVKALQQRFPQYKFDVKVEEAESKPFLDVSKVTFCFPPLQQSLATVMLVLRLDCTEPCDWTGPEMRTPE